MLYKPAAITTAELDSAQAPLLGGEWKIYASHVPAVLIGQIALTAAATGAYVDNPTTVLPASPGTDLQIVSDLPLISASDSVVTIDGTGTTDPTLAGIATFTAPSWAQDQSSNFNPGTAFDFVTVAAEKYIAGAITLSSVTNGSKGSHFKIYQLPVLTDWTLIGCSQDFEVNSKSRKSIEIACGMDASAFTKLGMTQVGAFSLKAKLISLADGAPRFEGTRVTIMAEAISDGTVLKERIVLTSALFSVRLTNPEGENPSMSEVEGKYVDALFFTAS